MSEAQNNGGGEAPLPIAVNDPRYWRDCARRMRAEARAAPDPRVKALLRDIADQYTALARWTARHGATGGWIERLRFGRDVKGDGQPSETGPR